MVLEKDEGQMVLYLGRILTEIKHNNYFKTKTMTTLEKIGTAGVIAAAAFGIYWFFIREGEEVAEAVKDAGTGGGGGGTGGGTGSGISEAEKATQGRENVLPVMKIVQPSATTIKINGAFKPPIKSTIRPISPIISATQGRGTTLSGATTGRGANGSVSWSNATGYIC